MALKARKATIQDELLDACRTKEWQYRYDVAELEKDEARAAAYARGFKDMALNKIWDEAQAKLDNLRKWKDDLEFEIRKINLQVRRLELDLPEGNIGGLVMSGK